MKQNDQNPYGNYGYAPYQDQQQTPYYNGRQQMAGQGMVPTGPGQQPVYNPSYQTMPHQNMPGSTQYQGGPLEASGGYLVPIQSIKSNPSSQQGIHIPGMLPIEQSYIENILRLNKGKLATVYMTFENNTEWNAQIFKGIIDAAGRDHIILSDPQTGMTYLLLMVYLDYVTFDEPIEYDYPFNNQS